MFLPSPLEPWIPPACCNQSGPSCLRTVQACLQWKKTMQHHSPNGMIVSALPWRSTCPSAFRPANLSRKSNHARGGAQARYNAELLPFMSTFPNPPVVHVVATKTYQKGNGEWEKAPNLLEPLFSRPLRASNLPPRASEPVQASCLLLVAPLLFFKKNIETRCCSLTLWCPSSICQRHSDGCLLRAYA